MNIEPHKNGAATIVNTRWQPLSLVTDYKVLVRVWPRVRLGCLALKVHDKNGDAGNWTPEHVRAQLDLGLQGKSTAKLWLITNPQGATIGFVVTIVGICPYLNVQQSLIVWLAYTFERMKSTVGRGCVTQLEEYTRESGLRYIDTYTVRPGIIKWLQRFGRSYRTSQFLVRKDVWKE